MRFVYVFPISVISQFQFKFILFWSHLRALTINGEGGERARGAFSCNCTGPVYIVPKELVSTDEAVNGYLVIRCNACTHRKLFNLKILYYHIASVEIRRGTLFLFISLSILSLLSPLQLHPFPQQFSSIPLHALLLHTLDSLFCVRICGLGSLLPGAACHLLAPRWGEGRVSGGLVGCGLRRRGIVRF